MAIVYLGLGSNVGDRKGYIQKALFELGQNGITIQKTAQIIETEPVGGPPQSKFLNTVIKASTELSVENLFKTVKSIEKKLGRRPTVKNGPRIIDIDILLYNELKIKTPHLTIPHPLMFTRDFVLRPLKEIAPEIFRKFSYAHHNQHS